MTITLFKCADYQEFVGVLERAVVTERSGTIHWGSGGDRNDDCEVDVYVLTTGRVTSILIEAPCASVIAEIARQLRSPYINVFFQEHMFWEFSLVFEGLIRMKFSTAPEEWGEVEAEGYVGTPADLADIWAVPVERIERYMVNWKPVEVWSPEVERMTRAYLLSGQKAYPGDEYGFGQEYQGLDFIRALGGDYPVGGQSFRVCLPPPRSRRKFA